MRIFFNSELQNHVTQIKSYIFKQIAENSQVYEIINENEFLADFQIKNKITNQR